MDNGHGDSHGSDQGAQSSGQGQEQQAASLGKENCLFCQIIDGRIPSKKVFEDEQTVGVLDINPANAGHILLMPKDHHIFMPQVPDDVITKIFANAKLLSQATLKALQTEGTTIFVANGGLAGQRAPHFMVHIIPRLSGDALPLTPPENQIAKEVESQVKTQLQEMLRTRFGVNPPAEISKPSSHVEKKEEKEYQNKTKPEHKPESVEKKVEKKTDLDAITNLLSGDNHG